MKKICPFCGEEININAIKCRYCHEFLDNSSENDRPFHVLSFDKFKNINVNWKWKRRFELIERVFIGDTDELREDFEKISFMEKLEIFCEIYFSDFLSTLSVLLFGLFWYLFKGMWLKLIKRCAGFVLYCFVFVIICIFSNSALTDEHCFYLCIGFLLVLVLNAPYDYYDYKVFGKKW